MARLAATHPWRVGVFNIAECIHSYSGVKEGTGRMTLSTHLEEA